MSSFWILLELRMMEVVSGDNWIYKTCKDPVKSSSPTNQHRTFLQLDALLVTKSTVSEHWREQLAHTYQIYTRNGQLLPSVRTLYTHIFGVITMYVFMYFICLAILWTYTGTTIHQSTEGNQCCPTAPQYFVCHRRNGIVKKAERSA